MISLILPLRVLIVSPSCDFFREILDERGFWRNRFRLTFPEIFGHFQIVEYPRCYMIFQSLLFH